MQEYSMLNEYVLNPQDLNRKSGEIRESSLHWRNTEQKIEKLTQGGNDINIAEIV